MVQAFGTCPTFHELPSVESCPDAPWDLRILECTDTSALVSWRAIPNHRDFWYSIELCQPLKTEVFEKGIKSHVHETENGLYESEFPILSSSRPLSLCLVVYWEGQMSYPAYLPGGLFRIIPDYDALELMLSSAEQSTSNRPLALDRPEPPVDLTVDRPEPPVDLHLASSDKCLLKLRWHPPHHAAARRSGGSVTNGAENGSILKKDPSNDILVAAGAHVAGVGIVGVGLGSKNGICDGVCVAGASLGSHVDGYVCEVRSQYDAAFRVFVNPRIDIDGWLSAFISVKLWPCDIWVASVQREPYRRSEFAKLDTSNFRVTKSSVIGLGIDRSFSQQSSLVAAYAPYDFQVDRFDCGSDYDMVYVSWRGQCDEYVVSGRSIDGNQETKNAPRILESDSQNQFIRRFNFKILKYLNENPFMELRMQGRGTCGLSPEVVVPIPSKRKALRTKPCYRNRTNRLWDNKNTAGSKELISTANMTPLVTDPTDGGVPLLFRHLSGLNTERALRPLKRSFSENVQNTQGCRKTEAQPTGNKIAKRKYIVYYY